VYAPPGKDADDEYVLDLADRTGGHIVSNDLFKDFHLVREWVAHHTLRYTLEGRRFVAKRNDMQRLKLYVRSALWEPPRNRDDNSRPATLRVPEELGPGVAWKTESHQEAVEPLRIVCLWQSAGAHPGQFFEVKTLTHHFVLCKEGPKFRRDSENYTFAFVPRGPANACLGAQPAFLGRGGKYSEHLQLRRCPKCVGAGFIQNVDPMTVCLGTKDRGDEFVCGPWCR
jgi:hypothetical protein